MAHNTGLSRGERRHMKRSRLWPTWVLTLVLPASASVLVWGANTGFLDTASTFAPVSAFARDELNTRVARLAALFSVLAKTDSIGVNSEARFDAITRFDSLQKSALLKSKSSVEVRRTFLDSISEAAAKDSAELNGRLVAAPSELVGELVTTIALVLERERQLAASLAYGETLLDRRSLPVVPRGRAQEAAQSYRIAAAGARAARKQAYTAGARIAREIDAVEPQLEDMRNEALMRLRIARFLSFAALALLYMSVKQLLLHMPKR